MLWLLRTCSCLKNHAHKFPPDCMDTQIVYVSNLIHSIYQQSKKQTCVWIKAYLTSRCMTPNWNQSFPFVVVFFLPLVILVLLIFWGVGVLFFLNYQCLTGLHTRSCMHISVFIEMCCFLKKKSVSFNYRTTIKNLKL